MAREAQGRWHQSALKQAVARGRVASRVLLGDDGPWFELFLGRALGGAVVCLARGA